MNRSLPVVDGCVDTKLRYSTGFAFLSSFISHGGNRNSFWTLEVGRLSKISVLPRNILTDILIGKRARYLDCMPDAISK